MVARLTVLLLLIASVRCDTGGALAKDIGGRLVHNPLAHTCDSDVGLATSGCDVV